MEAFTVLQMVGLVWNWKIWYNMYDTQWKAINDSQKKNQMLAVATSRRQGITNGSLLLKSVLERGGSESFLMFPKIIGKKWALVLYNLWQCGSAFWVVEVGGEPCLRTGWSRWWRPRSSPSRSPQCSSRLKRIEAHEFLFPHSLRAVCQVMSILLRTGHTCLWIRIGNTG